MSQNQPSELVFNCESILDLIPEYAFGLTEAAQTAWIEANVQRCPDAVALLQEYRRIQDELRLNVPQVEPSAELGARLMAAAAGSAAAANSVAAPAVAASAVALGAAPAEGIAKPRRRTIRIAWGLAAVAVLALVATNVYWLTRIADLTQSNDLLTALSSAQQNAFVLTSTDALHWVRLADAQQEGGSTAAFMMWNSESKTGLLYARSFPQLQSGYKYHVWLTRPSGRVFVGILQVNAEGDGALLFSSPEPINDFAWAWVTAENGTVNPDTPPTNPVVKGELTPT